MKNFIAATFVALLLGVGLRPSLVRAQVPVCTDVAPADMISDFASWDWTVDRNDPLYCRTWAVRTGNSSTGKVYNAPWTSPQNGVMNRIATDRDYTRDKGWELLRMDFGGKTVVDVPYFILYNRYTGIIRTYFRLDNSGGTYNSGAVITMSHVDNTRVTAALSFASTPLLAPDQYLNQNKANQVISYVAKMSTQSGWIVGEFNSTYDTYFRDAQYLGSALQFQVYGIVENNIQLAGNFSFKTNTEEGFAIAGDMQGANGVIKDTKAADGTSLKQFVAKGKTILGAVQAEDVSKFLDNLQDGAVKLANSNGKNTASLGLSLANALKPAAAGGGFRKALGSILNTASQASAFLGIAGSLIGAIWPDNAASAPSFTPTLSKGSISLSGTINTRYPLRGVICQIPGTQHSSVGSTLPYYDNALGLFNLKRPLALNKVAYSPSGGTNGNMSLNTCSQAGPVGYPRPGPNLYDSYQVQADLEGVYNQAAGLEVVSAEAALISELPDTLISGSFQARFGAGYLYTPADLSTMTFPLRAAGDGCTGVQSDSYITAELNAGIVQQTQVDNGQARSAKKPSILQTPFLPFGCLRNLAFTTIRGSRVYLRVKVILRPSNRSQPQPLIYYAQDYEVAVTTVSGSFIYSNLPSPISNSGPKQVSISGQYSSPTTIQSIDDITSSTSTATAFATGSSVRSQLLAGNSIALIGDFSVTSGTEFGASIGLLSQLSCGPSLLTGNTQQWSYNTGAYRQALATQETAVSLASGLDVYPNPATGIFLLALHGYSGPASITVRDMLGKVQSYKQVALKDGRDEKIDASRLAAGIYLIQVTTSEGTTIKKIMIE